MAYVATAEDISASWPQDKVSFAKKFGALRLAFLVAALNLAQEEHIYRPWKHGVRPMLAPDSYPELKGLKVHEDWLTAADGMKLVFWEKKRETGMPHFLCFQGNTGHWGDIGPRNNPKDPCQAEARLLFLRAMAEAGAGFTAVCLRGFGKSEGRPGEREHVQDINAVVERVRDLKIPFPDFMVCGESLGTWAATRAATLTRPSMLSLQNAFTSLAKLGEDQANGFFLSKILRVKLKAEHMRNYVLRHQLATEDLFPLLDPRTHIHFVRSGGDKLIKGYHMERFRDLAKELGLSMNTNPFPNASHAGIPPDALAQVILHRGMKVKRRLRGSTGNITLQ